MVYKSACVGNVLEGLDCVGVLRNMLCRVGRPGACLYGKLLSTHF